VSRGARHHGPLRVGGRLSGRAVAFNRWLPLSAGAAGRQGGWAAEALTIRRSGCTKFYRLDAAVRPPTRINRALQACLHARNVQSAPSRSRRTSTVESRPGRDLPSRVTPMSGGDEVQPYVQGSPPTPVLLKPVRIDLSAMFSTLASAATHTISGQWEAMTGDVAELVKATGVVTDPGEVAWLLVRRALLGAARALIAESSSLLRSVAGIAPDDMPEFIDGVLLEATVVVDEKFFRAPQELSIVAIFAEKLSEWLVNHGVTAPIGQSVERRLKTYFVHSLHLEWQRARKEYDPLRMSLDSPFAEAAAREAAWIAYSSWLEKQIAEGMLGQPFGLEELYVPLRGYYVVESRHLPKEAAALLSASHARFIVDLQAELDRWLASNAKDDPLRVISGGPGCGKSSFAKMFAAHVARQGKLRVMFVPLHQFDPSADIELAIGEFVRATHSLPYNPLDSNGGEEPLLIVFDGLDELAMQGKVASEVAQAFVRDVERMTGLRNRQDARIRVLLSGRELVVQANASEFRKRAQILHVLPYTTEQRREEEMELRIAAETEIQPTYDPGKLLSVDQRTVWWRQYGKISGRAYIDLPNELRRDDLVEITAQPLLNYLVALSFDRGELDFTQTVNLNAIYADLFTAVYDRAYGTGRHPAIRGMDQDHFLRVMEEIGVAAWHGDGRTTTVREIEEHCEASNLMSLLETFQDGAKSGVTRLLTAFYFRQHGNRKDGERTFEFTHKSFGEYLTARRIVRAARRIADELETRERTLEGGWDERDALKHWLQICGPASLDRYLFRFLENEVRLASDAAGGWMKVTSRLLSYVLRAGVPAELLDPRPKYREEERISRNAEEALLALGNTCARATGEQLVIRWPDRTSAGSWLGKLHPQRPGPTNGVAYSCLSHLALTKCVLDLKDFWNADLSNTNFDGSTLEYAVLMRATLKNTSFRHAQLNGANFRSAVLENVDFTDAFLSEAEFENATLTHVTLHHTEVQRVQLNRWNVRDSDIEVTESRSGPRGEIVFASGLISNIPGNLTPQEQMNIIVTDGVSPVRMKNMAMPVVSRGVKRRPTKR
jgi:NACHT conflict system protein/pentapeptide repeat protein